MGEARCVLRKTDHGGIDGVRLMAEHCSSCGLEQEERRGFSDMDREGRRKGYRGLRRDGRGTT